MPSLCPQGSSECPSKAGRLPGNCTNTMVLPATNPYKHAPWWGLHLTSRACTASLEISSGLSRATCCLPADLQERTKSESEKVDSLLPSIATRLCSRLWPCSLSTCCRTWGTIAMALKQCNISARHTGAESLQGTCGSLNTNCCQPLHHQTQQFVRGSREVCINVLE